VTGFVVDALRQTVEPYDIDDPSRIVSGNPVTSQALLWATPGSTYHGVWEMTEGSIERFDADEVFIVLVGRATVEYTARGITADLGPGTLCVLTKGDPARITVHETVRKVFATHHADAQ
jgi:uncharacterized cupin superfamily protein